ncbi:MAG TPA: hypothetical protein VGH98_06410 [Gemmatimonadaceae bacterium]|jgi:hypothetical protein
MNYTVWRRGVLLGRTHLGMPSPGSNFRAGQLEPTAEFEGAWPPPRPDADATERGRQMYEWLSAHPDVPRLRAASIRGPSAEEEVVAKHVR